MTDVFSSDLLSKDADWFSRPGRMFIKLYRSIRRRR